MIRISPPHWKTELMNPQAKEIAKRPRAWLGFWFISLLLPFLTSWSYCDCVWHNGGLAAYPEFPIPIYLMSGLLAAVGVLSVLSAPYKLRARLVLCCISLAVVILVSALGMWFEFLHAGFGLGP
jgi:hypothetical protein